MRITTYIKRALRYVLSGQPTISITAGITYLSPGHLLDGKKILITGGGRGLGKAMATEFIRQGAKVVITGRNVETLRNTSEEIGCNWLQSDVTDLESHIDIISQSKELMGGLDVLVNNAGISLHEGSSENVSPSQFEAQINCNLKGGYFLSQTFIKHTDSKSKRNILFISSERGFQSDDLPYGLTKAAINSLIKGLAYRYVKSGVRVNGVAPGVTSSDMTGVAKDGNLFYPANTNDRAYLPEEVAQVACFLISDISGCVSGQIIQCNEAKTANAHWK